MVHYKERTILSPGVDTHCTGFFNQLGPLPTAPPSRTLSYRTPNCVGRYERLWEDDLTHPEWGAGYNKEGKRGRDSSGNDIWKPCQHYVSYMKPSTPFSAEQTVPWTCPTNYADGYVYRTRGGTGIDPQVFADHLSFRAAFGDYGRHNAGLDSMTVENSDQSFVPAPIGLDALVEGSLKSCLPHIKAELSSVNSIIELKDLLTIRHTLAHCRDLLRNIERVARHGRKALGPNPFSLIRRSFDPYYGLTLRELLHSTADGYLQAEFNVLPLISDVCAIFRACASLSKRMNRLVTEQGRRRVKHFSHTWLPSQFTSANSTIRNVGYSLGQFAGDFGLVSGYYPVVPKRQFAYTVDITREVIVDTPAVFHATIDYNYYYTQYQLEHARVLGFLDSIGVNLNPVIIWNAIPWSFVIDWVFGINRWLDGRKTLNMEPVIAINRYMWSWKYHRRIRIRVSDTLTSGAKIINNTYLPDLYEEAYRRDVALPSINNSLFGSGLSADELSLGASLAITRSFHPKFDPYLKRNSNKVVLLSSAANKRLKLKSGPRSVVI